MSVNILCSMDLKIGRTVAPWLLRVLLGQRNSGDRERPPVCSKIVFIGYLYPSRDRISKSYPARLTFYLAFGRTARGILNYHEPKTHPRFWQNIFGAAASSSHDGN